MTEEERDTLLSDLRRKLVRRKDEPGFAANSRELEDRITELEGMSFDLPAEPEPTEPTEPTGDAGVGEAVEDPPSPEAQAPEPTNEDSPPGAE